MKTALGRVVTIVALASLLSLTGCRRRPPDATPDGAVRELVDRMRRVRGDPAEARAAFELLSKPAKQNLTERSQRYAAATGKAMAPEAMIAPSFFQLRFEPRGYEAQIAGAHALVTVAGMQPGEQARVPCVLEDGVWRVDVRLPPLPPVQLRPGVSPTP